MAKQKDTHTFKICAICGEKKPLAAFRQLAGTTGSLYSNICAGCRSSSLNNKSKEVDDGTTSQTGHQIDSKSKVYNDTMNQETFAKELEEYHKERKDDAIVAEDKLESKDDVAKKEKEHRNTFLDKKTTLKETKNDALANKAAHDRAQQGIFNKETANLSHAAQEKAKRTGHDFSVPFYDSGVAGEIRFQSDTFLRFRKWVGGSSPIGQKEIRKESQAKNNNNKIEKSTEKTIEKALTDYADKTWSPKSRGGR